MGAVLDDHLGGLHRVVQLVQLGQVDVQADDRLLDVDVLAGLDGIDGLPGVLVVGRGDDHGIDVRVFQQLAVVGIGLGLGPEDLLGFVGVAFASR